MCVYVDGWLSLAPSVGCRVTTFYVTEYHTKSFNHKLSLGIEDGLDVSGHTSKLVSEVIPSRKCRVNEGTIGDGFVVVDI